MTWTKTVWQQQTYLELREELTALADESYQKFHQKLITGNSTVLGVPMPPLRRLAKEIAKGDAKSLFLLLHEDCYEEMMIYGLILGYFRTELDLLFEELALFIPKINNWAVCDCTVAGLKSVKKDREAFFDFLQPYLFSVREYEVRFAVVALMDYYTDAAWIDRILSLYRQIGHQGYYVKMAVAWAVAEAYVKEQDKAESLLAEGCLNRETQNKAIQKIRESYRVTAENKERVKQYRL